MPLSNPLREHCDARKTVTSTPLPLSPRAPRAGRPRTTLRPRFNPHTLHPKPDTLNPKPETRNPNPQNRNPRS